MMPSFPWCRVSVVRRILYRWSGFLPLRVISDEGRPYLERYYLASLLGTRIYLHRFVDSDPDRGLHDHPWPWAGSIVLSGCYREQRRSGVRVVRWFNWLGGTTFHRVILPEQLPEVWTIFFHRARNTKQWGFLKGPDAVFRPASGQNPREWWREAPPGRAHPARLPPRE